jgi:hypothetical protein
MILERVGLRNRRSGGPGRFADERRGSPELTYLNDWGIVASWNSCPARSTD